MAISCRQLRGRCLPYGVGVTYWPLMEIIRADAGISLSDGRDEALQKLAHGLERLFPAAGERRAVEARLAVLLGMRPPSALGDVPGERVAAEVGWGFRRYVDALAVDRPTIVVIDDMQWAEGPFLEAFSRLRAQPRQVPLLLIWLARPEFVERHPEWSVADVNTTLITLAPLAPDEVELLAARLLNSETLPTHLRPVIDASAGNPLFCEQLIQMLADSGRLSRSDDGWPAPKGGVELGIPAGIYGVLASRIDALPRAEKRALQVASVIGEHFTAAQVESLQPQLHSREAFDALERRGLVSEWGEATELGSFRFNHLLVRDVAYASLSKSDRADLHERFGMHLEAVVGDRLGEFAEILGHHAERSFTLARELVSQAQGPERRARRALTFALVLAERALSRGDPRAVESFAQVARAAAADLSDRGGILMEARLAVLEANRLALAGRYADARAAVKRAFALAVESGHAALAASTQLSAARIERWGGSRESDFRLAVQKAIELYTDLGDTAGKLDAQLLGLEVLHGAGQLSAMLERGQRLRDEALAAHDRVRAAAIVARLAGTAVYAGRPHDALRLADEASRLTTELGLRVTAFQQQHRMCRLALFQGDLPKAEACFRDVIAATQENGERQAELQARRSLAEVFLEQGRHPEARELCEQALAAADAEGGDRWNRAELASSLVRALVGLDRLVAADRAATEATAAVRQGDITAQAAVASALAALRAGQGRDAEAEASFQAAISSLRATEFLPLLAATLLDYAEFLVSRWRWNEASGQVDEGASILDRCGYGFRVRQIERLRDGIARAGQARASPR